MECDIPLVERSLATCPCADIIPRSPKCFRRRLDELSIGGEVFARLLDGTGHFLRQKMNGKRQGRRNAL